MRLGLAVRTSLTTEPALSAGAHALNSVPRHARRFHFGPGDDDGADQPPSFLPVRRRARHGVQTFRGQPEPERRVPGKTQREAA